MNTKDVRDQIQSYLDEAPNKDQLFVSAEIMKDWVHFLSIATLIPPTPPNLDDLSVNGFQLGDKVVIVKNIDDHKGYTEGEIVELISIDDDGYGFVEGGDGTQWFVDLSSEIQRVDAEYNVEVTRIGYSTRTVTVIAESLKKAEETALDDAGNFEFSEQSSEYELE